MLTPAQSATLKTYILSQPDLSNKTSGTGTDYGEIARLLNLNATPDTLAWIESVSPQDSDDAPDYSTFDSIAAGKRESWGFFLAFSRDFTRNKTRKWITDVWGNATAGSNAEAILLAGTEKTSRAEVAIGGTSKTTGTVTALDRGFVGDVTLNEIAAMFNA
jgi:hypothetical protein